MTEYGVKFANGLVKVVEVVEVVVEVKVEVVLLFKIQLVLRGTRYISQDSAIRANSS